MIKTLLLLAGLIVTSYVPKLNTYQTRYIMDDTESFISEGYCYLATNFGPNVTHKTEMVYVSASKTVAITRTAFMNSKGHFGDMYIVFECIEGKMCASIYTTPFGGDESKKIPTTTPKECEGF